MEQQNGSINSKELFISSDQNINLAIIHNRYIVHEPMKYYYFNGCCIPGVRRLYVTVNGDFRVCERVGNSPSLGNVDRGIDIDSVKKTFVNTFMEEAVKFCNDCWAVHLCTNCYVDCFDENGINLSYRHRSCRRMRYSIEGDLISYHEILEKNPEALISLSEIKLI